MVAKQYSLVHRSAIHLEIFLKKIFESVAKFPKMIPSKHSTFIVLTRAVTAFGLPYYRYGFCGAQGRVTTGHTSILYIVKSKSESMEKQVMQSRSKGASV